MGEGVYNMCVSHIDTENESTQTIDIADDNTKDEPSLLNVRDFRVHLPGPWKTFVSLLRFQYFICDSQLKNHHLLNEFLLAGTIDMLCRTSSVIVSMVSRTNNQLHVSITEFN